MGNKVLSIRTDHPLGSGNISRLERGLVTMHKETAARMAEALGVSLNVALKRDWIEVIAAKPNRNKRA